MNISFTGKKHADAVIETLHKNPLNCRRMFKYKAYNGLEYSDLITDSFTKGVELAKKEHENMPGFNEIIDQIVDHIKTTLKKV